MINDSDSKSKLHPRNKHVGRYDLELLITSCPELAPFVITNAYDDLSIDFFNPQAVKMLNKALLKHYYNIADWNIPSDYLCPPIPGRADYIHYIADLLSGYNNDAVPRGSNIKCLDIGVGANCIYPLLGNKEYDWTFMGTDIDPIAVLSAKKIIKSNPDLVGKIDIKLQPNPKNILRGVMQENELVDVTFCNPPFHASLEASRASSLRKLTNLSGKKPRKAVLNFGGQETELWCEGGEVKFARDKILQSKQFATSCFWFTTLISKQENLKSIYAELKKAAALEVKTIPMGQGSKISRIVAWTFLTKEQQENWVNTRW